MRGFRWSLFILALTAVSAFGDCAFKTQCPGTISGILDFPDICLDSETLRYQRIYFNGSSGSVVNLTLKTVGWVGEVSLYDSLSQKIGENLNLSRSATVSLNRALGSDGEFMVMVRTKDVGVGGPYTLTLGCTGGGIPTDPDPPRFSIEAIPRLLTLDRGQSATVDVRVRPKAGFTGNVTVEAEAPSGISASLASHSAPGGYLDTTLSVAVATDMLPSTKYVTVYARFEDNVTAAQITVSVSPNCDPPKITSSPSDPEVYVGEQATLAVEVIGSSPVTFQWFKGAAGSELFPVTGATGPTLTTGTILSKEQYWLKAWNHCGSTRSRTFTLTPQERPTRVRRRLVSRP